MHGSRCAELWKAASDRTSDTHGAWPDRWTEQRVWEHVGFCHWRARVWFQRGPTILVSHQVWCAHVSPAPLGNGKGRKGRRGGGEEKHPHKQSILRDAQGQLCPGLVEFIACTRGLLLCSRKNIMKWINWGDLIRFSVQKRRFFFANVFCALCPSKLLIG